MKYWDALTEDAQNTILIAAFLIEAFLLFGVIA